MPLITIRLHVGGMTVVPDVRRGIRYLERAIMIHWSRLAAVLLVLLPIGGLSYQAQADALAKIEEVTSSGWSGLGFVTEPGTVGLLVMGSLWLFVRCVGRRR